IWEGTSNIQSLDMVEAMHKKGAHKPFLDDFIPRLQAVATSEARHALQTIDTVLENLGMLSRQEVQWVSKESLTQLADAAQVALLYDLAQVGGERYDRLARLYAHRFLMHEPYPSWALTDKEVWWFIEGDE
ncbi:MAG: acyl-CoA dehydrogenase, partial [Anaerolineales bacterium]